jgi:hypothetical protein
MLTLNCISSASAPIDITKCKALKVEDIMSAVDEKLGDI